MDLKRCAAVVCLSCLMLSLTGCPALEEDSRSTKESKSTTNTGSTVFSSTAGAGVTTVPTVSTTVPDSKPTTVQTTTPATSTTTVKPTTTKPTTGTTTAPSVGHYPVTDKKAKQIAEDLIALYDKYSFLGVCCDVEYHDEWMEQYLTSFQKQEYYGYQMRITCCSSVQEVLAHAAEVMHESLLKKNAADMLFTDNKGNVFVMYAPFGFEGVTKLSLLENTANRIVAKVEEFEYDPEFEAPMATIYYTIVYTDGGYKIVSIARDGWLKPALTRSEAQQVAKDLITRYNWYNAVCSCCDDEYVEGDMSRYLTKEQKKYYFDAQYKITCCKTAQEVRAHIDSVMDQSLIHDKPRDYPDDYLFTDNKGNLYLIIVPTECEGYGTVTVKSYSDERIEAKVEVCDYDGVYGYDHFVIVKQYGDYIIRSVTYTSA